MTLYNKHYVIGAGFLLNMAVIVMYIFICKKFNILINTL